MILLTRCSWGISFYIYILVRQQCAVPGYFYRVEIFGSLGGFLVVFGTVCSALRVCVLLMVIVGANLNDCVVLVIIIGSTPIVHLGVVGIFGDEVGDYYSSIVVMTFNMVDRLFIGFNFFVIW